MAFMNNSDKQRISAAIEAIERQTSGELVTVITRCSDDYRYIPYLWAALLALLVPGYPVTGYCPDTRQSALFITDLHLSWRRVVV